MIAISASERGVKNIGATWRHIVSDFSATPGGSGTATGDYTAFRAFRDWAVVQAGWVGLVLPPTPGSYYGVNGAYAAAGGGGWPPAIANTPFFGIPKLIVMGYGASMNGLHGGAVLNTGVGRADIHSVDAGATAVELIDPDQSSLFSVGGMILLAGLDMQGYGYPPNPHFMEWHRIASIDGADITFERPIKYDYKGDWPRYFDGHEYELGGIGAAAIVRTYPGWDVEHRIYGLRSYKPGEQTYYFHRKAYLFDVKSDDYGWIIGASEDHRIIGQDHSATGMEVDKLASNAFIGEYGPSNKNISVQSSSIDEMEVRGGTRSINGTAKHMLIHGGSSPNIYLGPTAYGISESIEIRDHVITTAVFGAPSAAYPLNEDLTYEGDGVFRYTGEAVPHWFIPGAVGILRAATIVADHYVFRILGVRSEDGELYGPILIDTNIVGADLPVVVGYANASILRHNAPNLTVTNCTGIPAAEELSLAPPNSPFGIITRRTYDGTPYAVNGVVGGYLLGRLAHLKINVAQAYTGAASTLTIKFTQFEYYAIGADKTLVTTHIRVNCKIAGERVITPSGVTGAQTGDVGLSDLVGAWMIRGPGAFFGNGTNGSTVVNISGEDANVRPIVTIEALTDQEF